MSNEFEPYNSDIKKSEFSAWDYQGIKKDDEPEISKEEILFNECERLKEEAIERGYTEGLNRAQQEIDEQKSELMKWLKLLQNPIQLIDEQITREMVQTIIWLSQCCIGVELSIYPEKLGDLINKIKGELPSLRSHKVLAMHPEDIDWVKNNFNDKELPGLKEILVADSSLNRGDFYLEGDHSELDGCIQTRIIALFAQFVDKEQLIPLPKSRD